MKTKPLRPSLREKKRYLVFEVISKTPIKDEKSICSSIKTGFSQLFGQVGLGEAGLIFLNKKYNSSKQRGLVRVDHKNLDKLRASLAIIKSIENKHVIVRSIMASGVLNKAQKSLA